jgi:hypothetical protein
MIKETLAFLLENSCSESSTLILETLNLQSSWDHAPSNVTQASDRSIQASKQPRITKNGYTKQKESFKRVYKRIGLVATVTRAKEMRKTELGLKRNNYRKICIIKEIKEL